MLIMMTLIFGVLFTEFFVAKQIKIFRKCEIMKTRLLAGSMALALGAASSPASAFDIIITNMAFGGDVPSSGTLTEAQPGGAFTGGPFNDNDYFATSTVVFDTVGNNSWAEAGGLVIPGYGEVAPDANNDTVWINSFNYDFSLAAGEVAYGLSFDWSTNYDIPVLAIFDCSASSFAGSACIGAALPMAAGPFPGQEPVWHGYLVYDSTAAFSSAASTSVSENVTGAVYTAAASAGTADIPTYSLSGTDAGLFTISNASGSEGELSFDSAPDHENPLDAGSDNVYDIIITATFSDATGPGGEAITAPTAVDLPLTVTVLDVNEASPVFSSGASISVAENNSSTEYTAVATDADSSNTITYSIANTGADDDLFNVDAATGVLTFGSAPDFEANGSSAGNNTYVVDILATDSGSPANSTTQTVTVNVTDVLVETLQITSQSSVTVFENVTAAYTLQASGPNSITLNAPTGADASLFNFDANTGALTFITPPDFDAGQTVYNVEFTATDIDGTTAPFPVTITIQDVNDQAPSFDSLNTTSLYENETLTGYTALTTDTDTIGTVVYSIAGTGADDALFEIDANTGVLSFITAPDYEANGSAANNNTYVVDVRAFDGTNASVQTVTVTVDDALPNPPTITAPGQCPIALTEGGTYSRPAATAVDDLDGNITSDIVVDDSSVDTSVPGVYVVTYNVSNSEGDAAPEVTCNVSVNGRPDVFINGAAVINMDLGDTYTEAGAIATDAEDTGLLTVTTTGSVDTSTAGVYDITYSATDSDGVTGSATRRVIVKAEAGVVLGIDSLTIDSGEFALADGAFDPIFTGGISEFVMASYQGSVPGVYGTTCDSTSGNATPDCTAQDYSPTSLGIFNFADFGPVGIYTASTDGTAQNVGLPRPSGTVDTVNSTITLNIPSWIAFWNGNSFAQGPTTPGGTRIDATGTYNPSTQAYSISWDALVVGGAFDGQTGHWSIQGTVNLVAFDGVYPEITLNGESQVVVQQNATYTEAGVASAIDNTDGDLGAGNVTISGGVDTSTVGTYTITYSIADSSGNVGVVTREVVVVGSGNQPLITLNGSPTVNIAVNSSYVDAGAVVTDVEDDNAALTASLVTSGSVDTSTVGRYLITYNVTDSDGNPAFQVTRTVNVNDVTVPVISVTGANPVYIGLGETYNDAGATATDDIDTNPGITNRITTDNPVNTAIEGEYTVTYSVVDDSGNTGTATRTVYVDGTAPVVSITGQPSIALNIGDTFTDAGASATDGVSGDLDITTNCDVDTSTAGRYSCTYVAVDGAGNETTVTRVITVLDTTIVVSEPVPTLQVRQNNQLTSVVVVGDGLVSVNTDIEGDNNTFDWSATDNNLVALDAITNAETFSFDPAELAPGVYELVVTTNAGTNMAVTSRKLIRLITEAPAFTDADTDGDGIADSIDGLYDDDNDGIPNYLDSSTLQQNELVVGTNRVMTSATGLLRMGTTAFAASDLASAGFSPEIDIADIVQHGGNAGGIAPANAGDGVEASCVGGCFDFEVSELEPGASVDVVIPLSVPLSESAVYRKYSTTYGWANFDTSGNDSIASSGLVNGVCPQPDAANRWVEGLFVGDVCVRLTIQDGGVNDADRVANGVVVDPGGVANLAASAEADRDFAEGCSATNRSVSPWERADWLVLAAFIALIGTRRKLKSLF